MKKIIIFTICLCTYFVFASNTKAEAANTNISLLSNDYSEVRAFLSDESIIEMTESYYETYKVEWNATEIKEITDIYDKYEEHMGYLVIFDEGYLAYDTNLSVLDLSTVGYPYYYANAYNRAVQEKLIYNSGSFYRGGEKIENNRSTLGDYDSNIFFPLYDWYYNDNLTINSSMVQIPYFKDKYDSSSWGKYEPISFSYFGAQSGSVLGAMGLMYTLKTNVGVDLTPQNTSWQDFRDELYYYTDFDYDENWFVDSYYLSNGVNKYLSDTFGSDRYKILLRLELDLANPSLILYCNNNAYSANFCMRVGHAQEPYFWVFQVYYDIIMANANNFYHDSYGSPVMWENTDLAPYYLVDQKYRNEMFQFFDGNNLIKL